MTTKFLYPMKCQFPFDAVCARIVHALAARAFSVPGFVVEQRAYGSGAQKVRQVDSITSDQSALDLGQHDVKIEFCRPQGALPGGRWNNCAAVSALQLSRRSLRIYEDESGPTYDVYVGDDWARDRSTWWTRPNARLNNEPRRCVQYSGAYPRHRGLRADRLVAVDDRREYGPEGSEPREFDTAEVMEAFRTYLHDVVLPAIEAYPVVDKIEPPIDLPVSMPSGVGPFFAYGDGGDARRIEIGKKNPDDLSPPDRYGMAGNGRRLAPLGLKRGADLPEVAFDGFLWCGTIGTAAWRVPGDSYGSFQDVLVKVIPKDARGIYVADHAAYERHRAEIATAIEGSRDRFTDAEVDDFIRARVHDRPDRRVPGRLRGPRVPHQPRADPRRGRGDRAARAVSRTCSVVDSIDCEASAEGLSTGPVVTCWACGDDVCRACSSVVPYRWRGQIRRMRFCFNCQDSRGVGRGEEKVA